MKLYLCPLLLLIPLLSLLVCPAQAKPRASVKDSTIRAENPRKQQSRLLLPYGFSSDAMGTTLGLGGMMKGYGQDQLLLGSTLFASFDQAVGLFLGLWDYQPPWSRRLFFSAQGMVGHYPRQRAYSAPVFSSGLTRPGSNDSAQADYLEESGYDNWTDFKLEYVLPLGSARQRATMRYELRGGLLQSSPVGGEEWNPLEHGVTTLLLRQFNRYRSLEADQGELAATVHPLELALAHDNTDFPTNPSQGSSQYLALTHDFGWLESPYEWTFIEFEASKYFNLGPSAHARQRIVALNLWTGDTPSWQEDEREDGSVLVSHRPPFYEGASLGGFYRMRGYPQDRFNDRAVIYSSAEYRYTLDWNPLARISWLRFLQADWMQLVAFVEGGRVANDYSFSQLLREWKVDAGVSLRCLFAGSVARLDLASSEEGTSMWVMFGHPF
ncbi:BamA/TamA family outer membrane protein [Desulfogranum mediterraneum]|uniref:BamA/TamA family outer membrane protein n=1 Tax=Desulfogranum mediterraneum TaxID=160661 RepID=UPI0003F563A2|nr:BamA/TamA family outer membrane protein [Desulfogranum mediterraneum]